MSERFSDEVLQRVLDAASEPEPFTSMRAVLDRHLAETPAWFVGHPSGAYGPFDSYAAASMFRRVKNWDHETVGVYPWRFIFPE
jgi:hypothetical protein